MKRPILLTAASVLALGASGQKLGVPPVAPEPASESAASEARAADVVATGRSAEALQKFLIDYPDSPLVGTIFGELVQTIELQSFEQPEPARIWRIYAPGDSFGRIDMPPARTVAPSTITARDIRRSTRAVRAAVQRLEGGIDRCSENDPMRKFHRCVADALDTFAKQLSEPKVVLPPATRALPQIVAQAARRVRAAPTRARARTAVRTAITQVRKSISLIKADEPVVQQMELRQGTAVVGGLELAYAKLEKATAL